MNALDFNEPLEVPIMANLPYNEIIMLAKTYLYSPGPLQVYSGASEKVLPN